MDDEDEEEDNALVYSKESFGEGTILDLSNNYYMQITSTVMTINININILLRVTLQIKVKQKTINENIH